MFIVSINGCDVMCDTAEQVHELVGKPNPISTAKLVLRAAPETNGHNPTPVSAGARGHARDAVLEAIRRHPDWRIGRLVKYTGLTKNTFQYQTRILRAGGQIEMVAKGYYKAT